ncbi:uncharacterized protein [Clytia hemisphaerica]|uniref:uncharacterized protein n=1 Tax=Clytia hemisphaerica TaxID=252671 RepID=UPI0034D52FC2
METPQAQQRRARHAQRMRARRANENEQQTQQRRQRDLERARNRRANENEQQTQQCRQRDLEWARNRLANENEQQTQERRQLDLERARNRLANENEQQTQERVRNARANENEQQTQQRRQLKLGIAVQTKMKCKVIGEGILMLKMKGIGAQMKILREDVKGGKQIPPPGIGPPTFRICGQICHRYGTLFPNEEQPQYAQLYIIEAAQALDLRMQNPSAVDCNRATMALIQDVLGKVNPWAFKHMKQVEQEEQNRAIAENCPVSRITMVMREGHDQRHGNAPLHEEVAAIFTGEDDAPPAGRNIVVYPRNHHLQSIPSTSSVVHPYIYPLLFPRGDLGWDMNMPHVAERATRTRNHVTQLDHYVYRLAVRRGFSALHLSGSPRAMHQLYLDAMAVVSKHGKPDAFLTFTCNPRWRELPDPETEPELYEIIKSNMIHGPRGALNDCSPCMVKRFPKSFNDETVMNVDGYSSYHRPDNGRTVRVRNLDLDNRWVVPYCPYLCKKYNAHINLEVCVSIKAVKYLYKYIYKGHDTAPIEIAERIDHDEIRTFLDARYVSSPEACWRLFAFPMHTQSRTVIRLAEHLPNFQRVYFREGEEENAADRAGNNETMLTAWFLLNQNDPTARQILYPDIPYDYVFIKSRNGNKWKVRERGHGTVISRMYPSKHLDVG